MVEKRARTNILDLYPPIERPTDLSAELRPELVRLGRIATAALKSRMPPHWEPPYRPADARSRLTSWAFELDDHIRESTGFFHVVVYLDQLDEPALTRVSEWLSGGWDDDPRYLKELMWRCDFSQRLVSAAMWMHRIGCERFH